MTTASVVIKFNVSTGQYDALVLAPCAAMVVLYIIVVEVLAAFLTYPCAYIGYAHVYLPKRVIIIEHPALEILLLFGHNEIL